MDLVLVGESGEPSFLFGEGKNILSVMPGQGRFVVEKVDLGGTTGLEQIDDALGPGCEVRSAGERPVRLGDLAVSSEFTKGCTEGTVAAQLPGVLDVPLARFLFALAVQRWYSKVSWRAV